MQKLALHSSIEGSVRRGWTRRIGEGKLPAWAQRPELCKQHLQSQCALGTEGVENEKKSGASESQEE